MESNGFSRDPIDECAEKLCNGCDVGCSPDAKREQMVEERLETTNLLLGHIVGRVANVAEAVRVSVREAEVRHDDWQESIKYFSKVMAKNQKVSAFVGLVLVVFVTTIVSVLVNLIM